MVKYDYIIVGSGFFGAICAHELNKIGKKVLVIDKRNHIGGNCYTEERDGINLHLYGPHIFHTSDEEVWNWVNKFTKFNNFTLRPIANYNGELYSLPFNMWTFNKLWGVTKPEEAKKIINKQSSHILNPRNLEEQAIKLVGVDVYEKLIKGYTEKQWKKSSKELPIDIIKRLPVRFTYDTNYFNDKYQGIPIGGYTKIFENLLKDVEVKLDVDFFESINYWEEISDKIIYTGPIDKFFNYTFGELEYKTTKFKHKLLKINDYQGNAMVNFTDFKTKYTRIIEHKHFENINTENTWITYEYPDIYTQKKEPFYPVNDEINNNIYLKYKALVKNQKKYYFGGRLAEYKYYDMDKVIKSALNFIKNI